MELMVFATPRSKSADYEQYLRLAQGAEKCGYAGFVRGDHYWGEEPPGSTDAWTTLAGLARETVRIRLGVLVTAATFRHPGPLAVQIAQVDQMSGGRVDFGLGAGWYGPEHRAYGIPFPPAKDRFDRLEESLAVITGLWRTRIGDRFSYHGRHFRLENCPALPKPSQPEGPPIVIGGAGAKRTPQLAARYASEFSNLPATTNTADLFTAPPTGVAVAAAQFERVRQACRAIDREPGQLKFSHTMTLCCGRTEAEVAARAEATQRSVEELRAGGGAGSPSELVDSIGSYAETGVSRIYLMMRDIDDLGHLELVACEVMPQLN
ncbi:TIGR03560 family F420-dependent LLM class oxidoreductase [Mycobacterium sp. CVI_P3]|uniref:TIGR03560 family F420-dependent LLM class oxidoreductase n=1 Tax=Mycobacterium pinniadriaticum TaxID=2994102 RepID=A0ABT3SMG9_9MYCO|nr:TIGR03560 family F420-dependent LLM class oxidoreductase [Mycobacterium pinniadriaticum]MCX2934308.1 TIGR03560 family F420-dependent LLM class oxidoreductase [Mycobacterium pinniadriaticum]MCX2940731.1 TIGR03560 family F420-dependent LLM class oxidoreductase [Mycobacterium pinniadriaticum]